MGEYHKYLVPVLVVSYGEDREEAIEYVEKALDKTDFVHEDGIYSAEVFEEEAELHES